MKKISLFALAFAVVGLSACAEEAEPAVDETNVDAEVVTPVEPADEAMEEMGEDMEAAGEEMMDDAEAAGEEMMDDAEAAGEEMEAEMEEAVDGE